MKNLYSLKNVLSLRETYNKIKISDKREKKMNTIKFKLFFIYKFIFLF